MPKMFAMMFSTTIKKVSGSQLLVKCISMILVVSILTLSVPAVPQLIPETIQGWRHTLVTINTGSWYEVIIQKIKNSFIPSEDAPFQETQEFRDSEVARIETNFPSTVATGTQIHLEAVPYDGNDVPVSGVRLNWDVENPNGDLKSNVEGLAVMDSIGEYKITVKGANAQKTSAILVTEFAESLTPTQSEKTKGQKQNNLLLPFEEWDPENIEYAQEPRNGRGDTPGRPKENSNFNILAPILSIAGRAGWDLNLNLSYNSRVWTKMGQDISYDMDKDSPAPGWSLGLGKIINLIDGGIVQVDGNGSKRFFAGNIKTTIYDKLFEGQSTDGSFIKAKAWASSGNGGFSYCAWSTGAALKYPNGTSIRYRGWADPKQYSDCSGQQLTLVPYEIVDKFGNYISITYHQLENNTITPTPGKFIDYIKDTLGRVFKFNYTQTNGRYYLTSITGPGLRDQNGVISERTFARFNYKDHTLAYNFAGLTPKVRDNNNSIKVLSSVYYPATNTGYWFGETDSYSPYGMIRKVEEQKGMGFDAQTGNITPGQVARRRVYEYPENIATPIPDVPEYTTVTETWDGMADPSVPAITQYVV